jgi:hypothetical protein
MNQLKPMVIVLLMLTSALAGCAGDENNENDNNSIEGDWYNFGDLLRLSRNGTVDYMESPWVDDNGSHYIGHKSGRWSTEAQGTYITLYFGHEVTTLMFEVRGDWLFILDNDGRDCTEFSRENFMPYGNNAYFIPSPFDNATNDQLPYPSFCPI